MKSSFIQIEKEMAPLLNKPGSLIQILQIAQSIHGYISEELIAFLAEKTQLPPTQILGVASFYSQFKLKPVGQFIIRICEGTACHVNGSAKIKAAVLRLLKVQENQVTEDGFYSVEGVACLGCCSLAPVMTIGDETFGKLTPEEACRMIVEFRKQHSAKGTNI